MKKYILIFILFSTFHFGLDAQNKEKENQATVEKVLTETTSKIISNDWDTFKSQFDEWSVGNLHIYSRDKNVADRDYYFTGDIVSPMFQQYLPNNLRKKVIIKGKEPYKVASIKGQKLEDYYILRINDGKSENTIVLYGLKKGRLDAKKTLAYFYKKRNRTFQMDSWVQDLNGDTRLDLIQKKQIKNKDGKIVREKTKVFLQKSNGKFKRSRRTKVEKSDYKMQPIK